MAQVKGQLDTKIEVVTPENIAFEYRLAGPFRRAAAYLIDFFLRAVAIMAFAFGAMWVFGIVGLAGFGIALIAILVFVVEWFYGGLLETFWNGQTIGKRILHIRVLTVEGQPINATQAIMRNILRAVDSLPFPTYLVGLISATMNSEFQRLGDLACGTIVVVEERSWQYGLVKIEDPLTKRLAAELPGDFEVSRSLGKALANYVDRRRRFAPGRRAVIARHVGVPLCARFGLPPDTSHDLLLCALYYRTFVTDEAATWDPSFAVPPPPMPEQIASPSGSAVSPFN